jgi:VCBS repeat-containing protein
VADTNSVSEGAQVLGNVLTDGADDVLGADGAAPGGAVTGVAIGSNTAAPVSGGLGGAGIAGTYGTLVLNADGSYTYTANPNAVTTNAVDHFVYTITDGDGDTSTVTLDITVNNVTVTAADTDALVNEAGLPSGSNSGANSEVFNGAITPANGTGPYTYELTSSANGAYGNLVLNPDGTYTYTLDTAYDGTTANNGVTTEQDKDSFSYKVTDANGNTATGTILVDIVDDVPQLSADNLAIANVEGTFTGNLEFTTGADVQTFAASFDDSNALIWTNPRDGFDFSYDPLTQTGTATFFDGTATQTFFTVKLNSDGTYDFNLVTPDPVTIETVDTLSAIINGGSQLPSYTISESNFDNQFKLVLTGYTNNGATPGTLTISNDALGVNDNVMHGNKDDVLRFDVQPVGNVDATVSSLTIHVDGTSGWKSTDQVSITVKYVEDGAPVTGTPQVWGTDQEVTFTFDANKTVDYIEITPVGNESFKIDGVSIGYTAQIFPDNYQLDFSLTGDDADGDTANTGFSVAVNTTDTSTYTITGTSEADSVYGTSGNDILIGGSGDDVLTGGLGADAFVWNAGNTGHDSVSDFSVSQGDTLNVTDLLSGGMVMSAVAESGHLQLQFSDGGSVVQTIDLTNLAVANNTEATNLMNQLLTSNNIVD